MDSNKLNISMFLLDMDGTIYLDDELIDGALDFINALIEKNIKYVFLTNNSSKSQNDYLEKLKKLNIPTTKENIYTSGMATCNYINEKYPHSKVYLMGTKALEQEFINYGINLVQDNPDIVVCGFDRELNYQKLEKACKFLCDGAIFLATNPDYVCPIANKRYIPDCGSICDMIYNATKKRPTFIGKPEPIMIDLLSEKYNIDKDRICMVGDRIYTDIKAGINSHTKTILVLSGESTLDTVSKSDVKPDYILNSINDIIPLIK